MRTATHADLFAHLCSLEMRYWDDADRHGGFNAADFYAEDCLFSVGEHRFQGRDAIRGFYAWRRGRGDRTARHLVTNLWLDDTAPDAPVLHGVMLLHAADGAPVLPSRPPNLIADSETTFVCVAQATWLVRSRVVTPVFASDAPPLLPPPATPSE